MVEFSHDYKRDYAAIERAISDGPPFCFVRFNDGEFALLQGKSYNAASGWRVRRKAKPWVREPLLAALRARLPGYHIGISPPCCLSKMVLFYRKEAQLEPSQVTFSTIFFNSNYVRALRMFRGLDAVIVGSGGDCQYRVPADGVNKEWDLDGLVDRLLEEATKPILLAAGPSACVIGHRYWERAIERRATDDAFRPQTILDVGATIDPIVHGHRTRLYHDAKSPLRGHACVWAAGVRRSGMAPVNAVPLGHRFNLGAAPANTQIQHATPGMAPVNTQVRKLDAAVIAQAAGSPSEQREETRAYLESTQRATGSWVRGKLRRKARDRVRKK